MKTPAPHPLSNAIHSLVSPANEKGFSLIEVLLVVAGSSLLAAGGFAVYQNASTNQSIKTEQSNIQAIASNAERVYGALGNYQGLTTSEAITKKVPPSSMISSGGLMSRWSKPVLVSPANIDGKSNAGLKISYQAVPASACAKLASAASEGMTDVEVGGQSVFDNGKLNVGRSITRCNASSSSDVVFTYYGAASGLAGNVLPPVNLPATPPTSLPPPASPPPAPPPVVAPPPPSPGCGAAPTTPATGTTPAGQACSFIWNSVAAPTCWASMPLCVPISPVGPGVPTAPSTPSAVSPPVSPPVSTPSCVVPSPATRLCATGSCVDGVAGSVSSPNAGTFTCPGGQLISTPGAYLYAGSAPRTRTQTVTRNETASCPDPFGAVRWNSSTTNPATYSPWNESYSCAPICVAPGPAPQSQAGPTLSAPGSDVTRTLECPAGQVGSITQVSSGVVYSASIQTRTLTYSCLAPIGGYQTTTPAWSAPQATGWGAPQAVGNWSTVGNTCTPAIPTCADGSRQMAAWFSADYSEIPISPSIPVAWFGDALVTLTPAERSRFQWLQQNNPVQHQEWYNGPGPDPTRWPADTEDRSVYSESCSSLADVGHVSYLYSISFQCVSNMGNHYCDYNDTSGGTWFAVCRSACESQLVGKSNYPYQWERSVLPGAAVVCTGQPGCEWKQMDNYGPEVPACNGSNVGQVVTTRWYHAYGGKPGRAYNMVNLTCRATNIPN